MKVSFTVAGSVNAQGQNGSRSAGPPQSFNVLFLMVMFIAITDMPSTKDTKTQLLILQQCLHFVVVSEDDL